MKRIDWVAVVFGILFAMWVAADRYVGFNFAIQSPIELGTIGKLLCLLAIALIALLDWRAALATFLIGFVLLEVADLVWKFIPSPDGRKIFAISLLEATPLIAALGAFSLWRALKRIRHQRLSRQPAPSFHR